MPKVIALHLYPPLAPHEVLIELGDKIRKLVAEACSTQQRDLGTDDIDWVLQQPSSGSIVPMISLEIETIGYPDRKEKLSNRDLVLELKRKILSIPEFTAAFGKVDPKSPLIWIKFQDPAGLHL